MSALALPASAQNASQYQDYVPLKSEAKINEPRLQRGRQVQNLRTADNLKHQLFARRLGKVSAIAGHETTLYVADKTRGIIYRIDDRNGDGINDGPRPLPQRFDSPTGLAMVDGALYVVDRNAIWRLTASGSPALIAGLKNVKSTGNHILRSGDGFLWLGLTIENGTSKLMRISLPSGEASLAQNMPSTLLDLSHDLGGQPWMLVDKAGEKMIGPSRDFMTEIGPDASQIWIPVTDPESWPVNLRQHIYIARPKAGDVVALPTMINRPVATGKPLFTGFTSNNGRTKWGNVSAIYQDTRGLFIADSVNGDIWRISKTATPVAEEPEPTEKDNTSDLSKPFDTPEQMAPKTLPIESGIGRASILTEGSQIKQGSAIGQVSTIKPITRKEEEAED